MGDASCHCLRSYITGEHKLPKGTATNQLQVVRISSGVLMTERTTARTTASITIVSEDWGHLESIDQEVSLYLAPSLPSDDYSGVGFGVL